MPLSKGRQLFLLVTAFVIFLGVLLPLTQNYPYYLDDYHVFKRAQETSSDPLRAWAPVPKYDRRHPLFFYAMAFEKSVFGFRSMPYFVVLFLLHFFNSLLVMRLCRSIGGAGLAPFLSAVFFLWSSASYQNLIFIQASIRVFCIFWLLLALLSWIQFLNRPSPSRLLKTMALQAASLLTMEDACIFPLLAFLLAWRILPEKEERNRIIFRVVPLFLLVDFVVLLPLLQSFFFSPAFAKKFSTASDLPVKLASLVKMFLQPLAVPEKGLFPAPFHGNIFRLGPVLVTAVLAGWFFRRRERIKFFISGIPWNLVFISFGWIAIAILPFLFQPLTFEHASRYLYLPLAGFSLIFGGVMNGVIETARTYASRKGGMVCLGVLVYIVALNLSTLAYHYERYRKDAEATPELRTYDRVKQLFATTSTSRFPSRTPLSIPRSSG